MVISWKRDWVLLNTSDFGSTHQLLLSVVSWNLPWLFTTHHGLKNIYFLTKFPMTPLSNADSYMASVNCVSLCAEAGRFGQVFSDILLLSWWCLQPVWCAIFAFDMNDCNILPWLLLNRFRSNERPHSSWCTLFSLQAFWHCHICSHCH